MNYDRFLTRVWDKQEKKMHYIGHPWSWDPPIIAEMNKTKDPDRFIPMMCTGLKDKNGKLIYEGDILRQDDDIEYMMIKLNDLNELIGDWDYYTSNRELWGAMEIIGNRFENVDLFEKTGERRHERRNQRG